MPTALDVYLYIDLKKSVNFIKKIYRALPKYNCA